MFRTLKVFVESDTSVRLIGECTKDFKDQYLGKLNGWNWQGGHFKNLPPHWVWGVKRHTPGGLDACITLVGHLLQHKLIDKVEIDYTSQEDSNNTPLKRIYEPDTVDPRTLAKKRMCMS